MDKNTKAKKIENQLVKLFKNFSFEKLSDDSYRYRVQLVVIPFVLCIVSFGMFILNIVTGKVLLMYATMSFSILSLLASMFAIFFKKSLAPSYIIFTISIYILFIYFLIFGGTEGFSPIWICLLPSCGMLMFGKKNGSIVCLLMLLIVILLLWTPLSGLVLQYEYTRSFTMRFPIAYFAFFVIGFLFEYVRGIGSKALMDLQERYKEQSVIDSMTGLHNRRWFYEEYHKAMTSKDVQTISLLMADIDFFKSYNDQYGHIFGDKVLVKVANCIEKCIAGVGVCCRWGGEEFLVMLLNADEEQSKKVTYDILEKVFDLNLALKEEQEQLAPNVQARQLTISIGNKYYQKDMNSNVDSLIEQADEALYIAKNEGRNRAVFL